jgi:pilus assembly protein CpaB
MSGIAAGVSAERTNRWLLIGAAVLAVLAGVLVFALLASFEDDDGSSSVGDAPQGANRTLVAREDISAGTTLSSDMFELRQYDDATLVTNPVQSLEAVDGRVVRTDINRGNQLSATDIQDGVTNDVLEEQLPFLFEKGLRGVGIGVDDVKIVGGHVRPGDYVDIMWQWDEDLGAQDEFVMRHTEYLFQDIEVLARTTQPVNGVVVLGEDGAPKEFTPDEEAILRRNGDVEPGDDSHAIVLKLAPEQTLRLMAALSTGEVTFTLRAYGDHEVREIPPIVERVTDE